MKDEKKRKYNGLTKREVALICISLLMGIFLIYQFVITEDLQKNSFTQGLYTCGISVVCSILATALWPSGIKTKDSEEMMDVMKTEIEKVVKKNQIATPSDFFYASNDSNNQFNEKLNQSISTTRSYIYFGDRALYLSERLGRQIIETHEKLKIEVLLADITDDTLFSSRSIIYDQRDRAMHPEILDSDQLRSKRVAEIICEEKMAVISSLYALGKLKQRYDIEIYLHKEIPFIRFEITDNLLVLSFLTELSGTKKYPSTAIYKNEGTFKSNYEEYATEIKARSRKLTEKDIQIGNLINMAKKAGLSDCTREKIVKHYEEKVKS